MAVHPRGHGEHYWRAFMGQYKAGSSPWARGTLLAELLLLAHWRFIPVGTGNTANWLIVLGGRPVHPRGHGEHYREPG